MNSGTVIRLVTVFVYGPACNSSEENIHTALRAMVLDCCNKGRVLKLSIPEFTLTANNQYKSILFIFVRVCICGRMEPIFRKYVYIINLSGVEIGNTCEPQKYSSKNSMCCATGLTAHFVLHIHLFIHGFHQPHPTLDLAMHTVRSCRDFYQRYSKIATQFFKHAVKRRVLINLDSLRSQKHIDPSFQQSVHCSCRNWFLDARLKPVNKAVLIFFAMSKSKMIVFLTPQQLSLGLVSWLRWAWSVRPCRRARMFIAIRLRCAFESLHKCLCNRQCVNVCHASPQLQCFQVAAVQSNND